MTFELAVRLTEVLIGLVYIQQSIEHFSARKYERILFIVRFFLAILLVLGFETDWVLAALVILALAILHRFQGPYNGGADRMGLLVLCSLTAVHFAPTQYWKEVAFGYLALQLVLSYFISGLVKIINPEWRTGRALRDVFLFSVYPSTEYFRRLSHWPVLLFFVAWLVMILELLFPFSLFTSTSLVLALFGTAAFHLSNVFFLGLNRFFWTWIAAYPSIIWLQQRLFSEETLLYPIAFFSPLAY